MARICHDGVTRTSLPVAVDRADHGALATMGTMVTQATTTGRSSQSGKGQCVYGRLMAGAMDRTHMHAL